MFLRTRLQVNLFAFYSSDKKQTSSMNGGKICLKFKLLAIQYFCTHHPSKFYSAAARHENRLSRKENYKKSIEI